MTQAKRYSAEEMIELSKFCYGQISVVGYPSGLVQASHALRQAASDARDAERYESIRDLCGHLENGSDTYVKIFQDDATRWWVLKVGAKEYTARTLNEAIDTAMGERDE